MTASADPSTPAAKSLPANLDVTIWHNASCGSSNAALKYLREMGIEPRIYLYLKEQPNQQAIAMLLERLNLPASALLRPNEDIGEELGVYAAGVSDHALIAAMALHPKLIQRPIVLTRYGAVIARPKSRIDEFLAPRWA